MKSRSYIYFIKHGPGGDDELLDLCSEYWDGGNVCQNWKSH